VLEGSLWTISGDDVLVSVVEENRRETGIWYFISLNLDSLPSKIRSRGLKRQFSLSNNYINAGASLVLLLRRPNKGGGFGSQPSLV
jgi:hypothetical protein